MDEAAPHCHVLLLPIVDGRMVGSDLHGGRTKLIAMQAAFQEEVRARYGMARHAPTKRHSAAVRAEAIRRVQDRLRKDGLPEAFVVALSMIDARDPEPLLRVLGLSMPAPTPRQSFVAIMTRPTKPDLQNPIGKARTNPIGEAGRAGPTETLPYPCVGKGFIEPKPEGPEQRETGVSEPASASTSPAATEASERTASAVDTRAAGDERGTGDDTDKSDCADEPAERYTRERDNDHLADTWDTERGEFKVPAHAQTSRRASAEEWVRRELSALNKSKWQADRRGISSQLAKRNI